MQPADGSHTYALSVSPGQLSVRKGEAGKPAPLTRLQRGLLLGVTGKTRVVSNSSGAATTPRTSRTEATINNSAFLCAALDLPKHFTTAL